MPFKYGYLLVELIKRDIKSRFKQSILGYAWVLLVPLINLLVMSIVFSFFVRIPTGGVPYPMYLFTGLVPWLFTANSIIAAAGSVIQNSSLVTKIALPRQIFPTASVFSKTLDFLLNLVVMFGFMLYFRVELNLMILFLPIIFFSQTLLILGVGYILSSINVYFRDVENVLGVFVSMWMYLTPVFYPPELVPASIKLFFNLNPMTPIINSYRNILLYKTTPPWESFFYSIVVSVVVYFLGLLIFKRLSKNFADVI